MCVLLPLLLIQQFSEGVVKTIGKAYGRLQPIERHASNRANSFLTFYILDSFGAEKLRVGDEVEYRLEKDSTKGSTEKGIIIRLVKSALSSIQRNADSEQVSSISLVDPKNDSYRFLVEKSTTAKGPDDTKGFAHEKGRNYVPHISKLNVDAKSWCP